MPRAWGRQRKRAGIVPAQMPTAGWVSAFDNIDDLTGLRTHDDISAVHQDYFIAPPLRIDFDDPGRKGVETDRRRNSRAHRYVEVHIRCFLDLLRPDGGNDLTALLGGRCSG